MTCNDLDSPWDEIDGTVIHVDYGNIIIQDFPHSWLSEIQNLSEYPVLLTGSCTEPLPVL